MLDLQLFAPVAGPGRMASRVDRLLAEDERTGADRPGTFERDAFAYSGRPSMPLSRPAEGPVPMTTTVASPDVKEDESQSTYESLSSTFTGVASTVGKMAGMALPMAMAGGLLAKAPAKEG